MDQFKNLFTPTKIAIFFGVALLVIVLVFAICMKKEQFALNGNKMVAPSGVGAPPLPTPISYMTADTTGNLNASSNGSFGNINATGSVYLNGYPGNVGDVIVSNGPTTPAVWAAGVGLSDFSSNVKTNGYQKLPGGLIIQWGVDASTGTTLTFPIPFPTSCLAFLVSLPSTTTANQEQTMICAQGAALSNTTYQVAAWGQLPFSFGALPASWVTTLQVAWVGIGF